MACVDDLPNEVLERVFSFVDGVSLAKSLAVCCQWRDVIENQLRIHNLWRKFCVREIPEEMLLDLLGGFELGKANNLNESKDSVDDDFPSLPTMKAFDMNVDWKYIYKIWHCSSKIRGQKTSSAFNAFDSIPIMCCKVSGSYVITGHRNGSVCAWEFQTGQLKRVVAQHLRIVTDLALIDLLKKGPYGDKSCLSYHHHVISVSKDHTIIISPLIGKNNEEPELVNRAIIFHHSHVLESVKVFGNNFAVSCLDNTVSMWRVVVPNHHWEKAIVQKTKAISGPPDILQWIGFWKDKVICVCRNTVLRIYYLKDHLDEWVAMNYAALENSPYVMTPLHEGGRYQTDHFSGYDYLMLTNAFLFWSTTIILFSADYRMWISIDGRFYFRYELWEVFRSNVQTVALKAGIFALGLETGLVVAFKIKQPLDLISLDFKNPTFSTKLSVASIIGLDIGDINGEPVIAACTTESVIVISWESHKLQHYRYISASGYDSSDSF